jgi:hypothetical protein
LKQGIEDGFLAPYRVHRVVSSVDATGWRPTKGEKDKTGREIPDGVYGTSDFERVISFKSRTEAVARHLSDFLIKSDRFAKTIVFCVDQEHAEDMRKALNNCNYDLVQKYPDYVCRVVSDEGDIGRGHLDRFLEPETKTPVILTTSQLLTTDPEFDGEPALITDEKIDDEGNTIESRYEDLHENETQKDTAATSRAMSSIRSTAFILLRPKRSIHYLTFMRACLRK